jgi:hypothetical protein
VGAARSWDGACERPSHVHPSCALKIGVRCKELNLNLLYYAGGGLSRS